MPDHIIIALRNILETDPEVKPEYIEKAIAYLQNGSTSGPAPEFITYKLAAKYLDMTVGGLMNLIKASLLDRAILPGRKKASGVTRESYIRFTTQGRNAHA